MTKGSLSDGHCTRAQRTRNYMRHYHDCTSRLFSDGRADDYLNELFLNAAKNGDYERVQNFLARTSRNASVNVDAKDKEGGYTAVMLAAMNEHQKVVSLLLNYGADITLCNSRGQSVLDFASDSMRPLLLGSVARQGYSSRHLLQAAWQGNVQLVKRLLSSKSMLDVNCKNADGFTPLLLVTRDLNLFEKTWTVEDVQKWLIGNGFKEECELFRAEKICGKALRAVDRADLKEMGVRTMGRRILLFGQIQDLFGSSCNSSSTEQKSFDSFSTPFDRLLTQSEKKKLTMEEKGIYNTKKKMIIAEVCKQWPEEEETPWFGKNSTEGGKLMSFIDRLANDERFTFPKYGLGRNAIKDMTLTHMRERRRAQKDATLLGSTSGESTVSLSSAEDSSSSGSTPPPSLFDKKRKEYVSYFNPVEKAVMENGYHPVEVVKELIHHKADCGAKDSEGKRPLHFAAHGKGSYARDVVDVLIEKGASEIDVPDRFSNSPLHWATEEDNQPILLALIKGGANVNAKGYIGKTPLHIAASHGFERASDTLLYHGADVTITDDNGLSPVDVAKGRRVQVVLKDAWAEQTKYNKLQSKRIFSAPVPPHVQQDSVQPSSELTELKPETDQSEETARISTAPLQGVENRKLKKRSQSSITVNEISVLEERTGVPGSRKISDVRMPKIPSAQKTELLSPGSKANSASVGRAQSGKQEFTVPGINNMQNSVGLPSLSVLNIELRYVRNLRGEKQALHVRNRKTSSQLPSPPNFRLRHRLSSPVLTYRRKISPPGTPDKDARLRSSSTCQVQSSTCRLALPSRVPPLGGKRVLTPELRSTITPELAQENISFVPEVVDLDLLRKEGLPGGITSPVFLSEVQEVTPPPPSPRGESRSSNKSQEEGGLESSYTQMADETDMTRTFTSIPRPTFWIPVGENDTEQNEIPSVEKTGESSSNGTKFYIDLSNLEALASGQCSLCGKSLPEETPASRRGSIPTTPDKELCKSCKPRRGSNEDVFWIPFTERRKASALKNLNGVQNDEDSVKPKDRRKSNDKITEQSKVEDRVQNEQRSPASSAVESSNSQALVLANNSSKPGVTSLPSDMTGFDVSCVCDNNTGVCSCTIVKKDMSSLSPVTKEPISSRTIDAVDVVKTVGEASPLTESTLVSRTTNDYASPTRAVTPTKSKSPAKKESDVILKSFSEIDIHHPTTTVRKNEEHEEDSGVMHQDVPSEGAKLSPTQEALNGADRDGPISNATVEPSPPKQAWTTPRLEEPGASAVKIINPFPSPVPPEDKSAVHPPIGPAGDGRIANKKLTSGKKGKRTGGKPASNSKNSKPRTKSKPTEQNGKGSKKKGKGKKKGDMTMITVQQREAGEELGLRTISQGGLDVAEESMDYLSTFRPFNARMFKGKHPILSPIPESPRSTGNTPRGTETTPRAVDLPQSQGENSAEVQEGKANDVSEVGAASQRNAESSQGEAMEGDFDVVDGGMFNRVIGMCVPRLKFGKSDMESDSGSEEESSKPLLRHPQGSGFREQRPEPVETSAVRDSEDRLSVGNGHPQVIQDEADDDMEDIVRRELSLGQEREGSAAPFGQHSDSRNEIATDDSLTNVTSHTSSSLSRASADEESILSYRYSRDPAPEMLAESESTNEEEQPSSETSSYSEQYSDTDSSYNSCGSTSPRPLSPASSLNSSDTYFSSPRDSSCAETPTPDRDMCSENSVEIDYYERMAREKSGVSSASSSSSSTIRTQSNVSLGSLGNISQGSVGSFSGSVTENVVRSRLSASARSQSSESCEEEIVWKKGNVLGRGAFGTVWCGLTNIGEMIAVKQVELNHSNLDEAEEQYEKLQEEVSLLKSLKHKNIVKFIGTCLDGGVVNIFMEFVPGGSIASILARFGCLDEPVFSRYTKQLLSGVSYLHSNNVIHRDIKGGNILIMPSGVLKLIDFGCAKRLYMNLSMSRSNILRSMKGTPFWMAPEVIRETGHGRKSDIWSVGCTVFEMATGKPPWSDMPPMAAIFAIGSGSLAVPQLSEDFSPGARDFVNQCLTRDPDLRPSADELLQHHFLGDPQ